MVKKITINGTLDFSGPDVIFNCLFGNDEFIKRFHKKFNHDPDAEASNWNTNNEREVKYITNAQAPKMISRVVGDSFPVKEVQKYSKKGNSYTVACSPVIDSPVGNRVSTKVETKIFPGQGGKGCVVTTNVILECKGIWGLDRAIENFMETKTRETFEEWMNTARLFCEEKLALTKAGIEEKLALTRDGMVEKLTSTKDGEIDEYFFDADDACANSVGPGAVCPVVRDASDIQISSDALKGHLEKLYTTMLKIEADIADIKLALQRKPASPGRNYGIPIFMGLLSTGLVLGFFYLRVKKQQTR